MVSVHPGSIATDMAAAGGFGDMAAPASLVVDAIVDALTTGKFHAFPDPVAKQVGSAYESFAANVVEAELNVA